MYHFGMHHQCDKHIDERTDRQNYDGNSVRLMTRTKNCPLAKLVNKINDSTFDVAKSERLNPYRSATLVVSVEATRIVLLQHFRWSPLHN